jgi:hypothetical protein
MQPNDVVRQGHTIANADLRFIERNGRPILQQRYISDDDQQVMTWRDVPLADEAEQ